MHFILKQKIDPTTQRINRIWRDRKIVGEEEWENLGRQRLGDKILNYLPEKFIGTSFLKWLVSDQSAYERWQDDYYDYLDSQKDPKYGKDLCRMCILSTDPENINHETAKFFQKFIPKFPCTVINAFECPLDQFKEGNKGEFLETLSVIRFIDSALVHAIYSTSIIDELKVDVSKDLQYLKDEYNFNFQLSTEKTLIQLKELPHPVRTCNDIFDIFSNQAKFEDIATFYVKFIKHLIDEGHEEQKELMRYSKDSKKSISYMKKIRKQFSREDFEIFDSCIQRRKYKKLGYY